MAKTVASILATKGRGFFSIGPDESVYRALEVMAEHNVGALPVIEEGQLVGIMSERDYARRVILLDRGSKETKVSEIMTAEVRTITPDSEVTACMGLMTDHRIRHLPVVEGVHVVGVISIGDVVKQVMADQAEMIEQLEHYIRT